MTLPTDRTTANTPTEHVNDHNTAHGILNALNGTYVPIGSLVFNAKDYGATGDGTTDDRAAINAAINAANAAGGGTVLLPAGTYKIASSPGITMLGNVTLQGDGMGTILNQAYWPGLFQGVVKAVGTYAGTDVTGAVLTVDAAAGATTLTMTSTANLSAGSSYLLGADKAFMDSVDTNSNAYIRYRGELIRVKSVDSGTQVTVYGYVRDNYAVANAASLRAITFLDGVGLRNFRLVNTEPDAHTSDMIQFQYCSNFRIEGVSTEKGDGAGINLDMCQGGVIANCRSIDLTDNSGANRYGYAVQANRATEDVVISGLRVTRGRHGFTTSGIDNKRGVPRNITLVGCVSNLSNSNAWDTHNQGANISFVDCHAMGSVTYGFYVRSPDTRIIGCSVSWCRWGIQIDPNAFGASIQGNVLRHLTSLGIILAGAKRVTISDNTIDGAGLQNIWISQPSDNPLIVGNRLLNPGQAGANPGITIDAAATGMVGARIYRNVFGDYGSGDSEPGSAGNMTVPINIAATGPLNSIIADNRAFGASSTSFITDSSTGTVAYNNVGDNTGFTGYVDLASVQSIPAEKTFAARTWMSNLVVGGLIASGWRAPGIASNSWTTPDTAGNSLLGDQYAIADVSLDDWTPTVRNTVFAKLNTSGNQRAVRLAVETNGLLSFSWSTDGNTPILQRNSSVVTGLTDGSRKQIAASLDVDNGSGGHDVKFWMRDPGGSWTQLGSTVTTAGTTSVFDSTATLSISGYNNGASEPMTGHVYYIEYGSGTTLGGSAVAKFDPTTVSMTGPTTPATYTAPTGEVWTAAGTSWSWDAPASGIQATSGVRVGQGGTTILKHLSSTKTWDPASTADGAMTSTTTTVTGAAVGDTVAVGFSQAVPAGCILSGSVTATDTVTVTLFNKSGSSQDLASGTLRADVWQH